MLCPGRYGGPGLRILGYAVLMMVICPLVAAISFLAERDCERDPAARFTIFPSDGVVP